MPKPRATWTRREECDASKDDSDDETASEAKKVPRTTTNTLGRSRMAGRKPARYDYEARPEDGRDQSWPKGVASTKQYDAGTERCNTGPEQLPERRGRDVEGRRWASSRMISKHLRQAVQLGPPSRPEAVGERPRDFQVQVPFPFRKHNSVICQASVEVMSECSALSTCLQ